MFAAFGCALPPPPSQGWVKFNNGRAEFGCDGSDLTWALNCQDQAWVGKNETCVAADGSIRSGEKGVSQRVCVCDVIQGMSW